MSPNIITKDMLSGFVKRATDILFVMNPKGTSVGVVLGIVLNGLTTLFKPSLEKQQVVDFSKVNTIYFIFFGIFVFNLPGAFRRNELDPKIETALKAIRDGRKKGELTQVQARLMYLNLYEKVLSQVTLDQKTRNKVKKVERAAGGTDNLAG
jgi:hypothetical protein